MYYLVYISTSAKLMSPDDLAEILATSRENNLIKDVTGMLLYSEGTFIQALEGEEDDVTTIYHTILQDPRHKNIISLIAGEIDERIFPQWSMGYAVVNTHKIKELEGYINPNDALFKGDSTHPVINILKTFIESNNLNYNNL